MLSSKHITKITVFLTALVLVLCVLAMVFSDNLAGVTKSSAYAIEYEEKIFNTDEIVEINIIMDDEKWEEMLQNAMSEVYYECDVVVNGTTFQRVGIRPKGNTSLSSIARDPDNNRYSFKLEFDQFVDGQTCFGLDKLVLNNSYADNTNMKEAIIYDMFQFLGADASLYNYAKMSVNDEYWGVYMALEAVEESFMLRNYGMENGFLYKPDSMNFGGKEREQGGEKGGNFPGMGGGRFNPENMPRPEMGGGGFDRDERGGRGGFGGMGGGSNLNYTDDNLDSYSSIWNAQVTDSSDADHKRVVEALKNVHNGTDIEKYIDVDQILKYMAVHDFAVNDDSLSGSMAHNYYLYEANGQISVLPWDYNLSLGGMHGGDSTSIINEPIDDLWRGTQLFDFVLENEEYKSRYHEYYNKLINEYIYGGEFDKTYKRICLQLDSLVKDDPNKMHTYEEFVTAIDVFYDTVMLRGASVKGQLDGTIPSTSEGQTADASSFIDASHIDLSDLGQFMMGGFGRK